MPSELITALTESNTQFALALYRQIGNNEENLFCSPYSISAALTMVYTGARQRCAEQMAQVLGHTTLSPNLVAGAFHSLDLALKGEHPANQRPSNLQAWKNQQQGQQPELSIANSLWAQSGYPFLADYIHLSEQKFKSMLKEMDFIGNPEKARQEINAWVKEKTAGKIIDLIAPEFITPLTRLILSNAIYFKAKWEFPFEPKLTQEKPFTLLNGSRINAATMAQPDAQELPFYTAPGFQAVAIPYIGRMSMLIWLPDEGNFEAFRNAFNVNVMQQTIANLRVKNLLLSMPRFQTSASVELSRHLANMGMIDAFDEATADFSGITPTPDLIISKVIHQAKINVDESGTEASAATAVVMTLHGQSSEPLKLEINRPFIFAIRHIATQTILFLGHIINPKFPDP